MKGLCVLVVDDSFLLREVMARELLPYLPEKSKIIKAGNPFEARDKILEYAPDMMILDIEMPKMNGIEFLRRVMPQYTQPTIMISGTEHYREMALASGAMAFVVKPSGHILRAEQDFFAQLGKLICDLVAKHGRAVTNKIPLTSEHLRKRLIAMGASTGGTEALASVLKTLYPPLPGIVIVQHIPPMFSRLFAERLDGEIRLAVKEAEDGDVIENDHVYIAPGNKQMRVGTDGRRLYLTCRQEAKVNGHCPSVDVLFHSVAEVVGKDAVGVILTGMGNDGAKGLLEMREKGSPTLGQDEETSVVYGMPWAAWKMGAVEKQLPLPAISGAITALVRSR